MRKCNKDKKRIKPERITYVCLNYTEINLDSSLQLTASSCLSLRNLCFYIKTYFCYYQYINIAPLNWLELVASKKCYKLMYNDDDDDDHDKLISADGSGSLYTLAVPDRFIITEIALK